MDMTCVFARIHDDIAHHHLQTTVEYGRLWTSAEGRLPVRMDRWTEGERRKRRNRIASRRRCQGEASLDLESRDNGFVVAGKMGINHVVYAP